VAGHQLGHMQVCISLQTDNHASTLPLSFFTGLMPFLPPNQQHQSTDGNKEDVQSSWWRGTVVERRSLAGELSLSCARPAADG